jgi:large subunit ribosomal protein L40
MEMIKTMPTMEARTFDARIRGLFPRELKIPVETPSKKGWNYEWNPIERPM